MSTKPNTQRKGKRIDEITRVLPVEADCFDEALHSDPFVSGLLTKIALLPADVIAPTAALLRLSQRSDSVGQLVRDAVSEAERGLLDSAPPSGSYSNEVIFWNGMANGVEIAGYKAKKAKVA